MIAANPPGPQMLVQISICQGDGLIPDTLVRAVPD